MTLDILIATYRRPDLLQRTLDSILRTPAPPGLDWGVIVVDNNSRDSTGELVSSYEARFGGRLRYVVETKQGLSHVRNAGIAASTADIVATIDDDEELCETWFSSLHAAFSDPTVDYIGGPYHPRWETQPPDWLPVEGYAGVVGVVNSGPEARDYGPGFNAAPVGGNSAFRRPLFEKIGPYDPALGRTNQGLLSCEDHDLFLRLQAAGLRGRYIPDFGILHWIPNKRMTGAYHREWVFWRAVSAVSLPREEGVTHLFGVPRYYFGEAVRRSARWVTSGFSRRYALLAQLYWIEIAGRIHGQLRASR